jgi:hypothetical protein
MKIKRNGWRQWLGSAGFCLLILGVILWRTVPWGEASEIPAVRLTLSNDSVLITVTNGTNNEWYDIYTRLSLHDYHPWSIAATGALGATNFWLSRGPYQSSFYKAEWNDRDRDGIPSFKDADPNSSNVNGVLTITIQSPLNGANLQ